jgi:hypothetical protein
VSQRALHGAAAALGLLACLGAAAAAEPLALRIRNDTPAPLRCVLLLAHWYSEEVGPVAPGGSAGLALESGLPDGTVVRRNNLARAMAVEGLYCLTGDVDATRRASVPLDTLRKATGMLVIACRGDARVQCAVATPAAP